MWRDFLVAISYSHRRHTEAPHKNYLFVYFILFLLAFICFWRVRALRKKLTANSKKRASFYEDIVPLHLEWIISLYGILEGPDPLEPS